MYVDGDFVGNASTTLTLTAGQHALPIVLPGFKDWSRQITFLSNSDLKLDVTLGQSGQQFPPVGSCFGGGTPHAGRIGEAGIWHGVCTFFVLRLSVSSVCVEFAETCNQ